MNCGCHAPFLDHRPPLQIRLTDSGPGYSISIGLRASLPSTPIRYLSPPPSEDSRTDDEATQTARNASGKG